MSTENATFDLYRPELRFAEKLDLHARRVVEGFISGLHQSPYQGFSVEFAEHRAYAQGESTRHLDWKLLARTDKPYVKRYEAETNLRCWMAIDRSRSMRYPVVAEGTEAYDRQKLLFSMRASAALVHLLKRQRDAFGLAWLGQGLESVSEARLSTRHQRELFEQMGRVWADEAGDARSSNLAEGLNRLAERMRSRSMLTVFTDLFETGAALDDLTAALQHLRFKKHDVVVFHVLNRSLEMELGLDNRPYKLIDAETGRSLQVEPGQIREAYRERAEMFARDMKLRCGAVGVDWVEVDTALGYKPVLVEFLRRRSKMF
ncbi:DUF58 domain-containing protein [bacterium]|nr:DUF58 domain-containing protein [bacterium]